MASKFVSWGAALVAACSFAAAAATAQAGVVTFNTTVVGSDTAAAVYVSGGLTLTITAFSEPGGLAQLVSQNSVGVGVAPNDQVDYDSVSGAYEYLLFSFSAPVDPISIRFGQFTTDRATISSEAWSQTVSAADLVSGLFTFPGGAPSSTALVRVAATTSTTGLGSSFVVNQIVVDDAPVTSIPLPPAAYSGLALLAALGLAHRRRGRRRPL